MPTSKSPSILIIDNDEGLAAAVAARLRALDYPCVVESHGLAGIELFERRPTDLVITDLNMPHIDGIGVIQKLRAISAVPIIVMTGYQQEYRRDLHAVEGVVVISKPFRPSTLIDLVEAELCISAGQED